MRFIYFTLIFTLICFIINIIFIKRIYFWRFLTLKILIIPVLKRIIINLLFSFDKFSFNTWFFRSRTISVFSSLWRLSRLIANLTVFIFENLILIYSIVIFVVGSVSLIVSFFSFNHCIFFVYLRLLINFYTL